VKSQLSKSSIFRFMGLALVEFVLGERVRVETFGIDFDVDLMEVFDVS